MITQADCEGCGACCTHIGLPLYNIYKTVEGVQRIEDPFFERLPPEVQEAHLRHITNEEAWDYGLCYFLDLKTRRCKHYDCRPHCCRVFEPGEDACLDFRQRALVGLVRLPFADARQPPNASRTAAEFRLAIAERAIADPDVAQAGRGERDRTGEPKEAKEEVVCRGG